MTSQNGPTPRARNIIVGMVATLWGLSVVGQMTSQVFGFQWAVPTGLNEIGTAVVMWVLARNHQANKAADAEDDRPEGRQEGNK